MVEVTLLKTDLLHFIAEILMPVQHWRHLVRVLHPSGSRHPLKSYYSVRF